MFVVVLVRNGAEHARHEFQEEKLAEKKFNSLSSRYVTRAAREHVWYQVELWGEGILLRQTTLHPECCD